MKTVFKNPYVIACGDVVKFDHHTKTVEGVKTHYSKHTGRTYEICFTDGTSLAGLPGKALLLVVEQPKESK